MGLDSLYSVYIHWPFCRSRCAYCPFVALACHEEHMGRYHNALMNEINVFAQQCVDRPLHTLYIGGGTPSTWPDELLLDMSGKIKGGFCLDQLQEMTIEVNPGTVRAEQIHLWRQCGINRLSVGVQYADPVVLASLNRFQTMDDVSFVLANASKEFENISVDIMLGLPGVDAKSWYKFMGDVVTWPIKHVSLYCLMVHEHTPLYYKVESEKVTLPKDDFIADLYGWSIEFLARYGFVQYEVSNFAIKGYESKHNSVYWDRRAYKGFGLGACSFDGSKRSMNEHNLVRYMSAIEQGGDPTVFSEQLGLAEERVEKIMLGLRRSVGIRYELLMEGLSPHKQRITKVKVRSLCEAGLIRVVDDRIMLTGKGFVLEQEIIAELA